MATSTQLTASPNAQDPPLLNLPPELRNSIYHLVLTSENGERIDITLNAIKPRTHLLKVCSQIRTEAFQIFSGANEFRVPDLLG